MLSFPTTGPKTHSTAFRNNGKPDGTLQVDGLIADAINRPDEAAGQPISDYESWEHALFAWARIAGLDPTSGRCETNNAAYPHLEGDSLGVAFWSTVLRGIKGPKIISRFWRRRGGGNETNIEAADSSNLQGDGNHTEMDANDGGEYTENTDDDQKWEDATDEAVDEMEEDESEDETEEDELDDDDDDDNNGSGAADEENQYPDHGSGLGQRHLAISQNIDRAYLKYGGWRFVRSKKGYFCLTRVEVQEGDEIVVLVGADMPFLVRPTPAGAYRLLGEVYVHDIMHGELVRDAVDEGGNLFCDSILLY